MRTVHDSSAWEPACAERHMGMWLYEPHRFRSLASAVISGTMAGVVPAAIAQEPKMARTQVVTDGTNGPVLYTVSDSGMGIVRILGTMMKADSKFGGTSTVRTRRALRAMVADESVTAIMLAIDSGGGTAAGTDSLADEVAATANAKPMAAYIEDLGASAAYWAASQAPRISANRIAEVGSIGTVGVIWDTSQAFAAEGIKVHVITSSGAEAFKGAGADGTAVTQEQLDQFKREVNAINDRFVADIAAGRGMSMDRAKELADGRVHIASEAQRMGLIDAVETFDQAAANLMSRTVKAGTGNGKGKRSMAEARLRLADVRR